MVPPLQGVYFNHANLSIKGSNRRVECQPTLDSLVGMCRRETSAGAHFCFVCFVRRGALAPLVVLLCPKEPMLQNTIDRKQGTQSTT